MEPKHLIVFLGDLLGRLDKPSDDPEWISEERLMIELTQYEYLRQILLAHQGEILKAASLGPERLRLTLRRIVSDEFQKISRLLTSRQTETPDQLLTPLEVTQRARSFQLANEELGRARAQVAQKRRTFIHELVDKWVSSPLGDLTPKSEELTRALEEKLTTFSPAPSQDLSDTALLVRRELEQVFAALVPEAKTATATAVFQGAFGATQAHRTEFVQSLLTSRYSQRSLINVALKEPDLVNLHYFVGLVQQGVKPDRAVRLTRVATAISSPLPAAEIIGSGHLFRALATTPFQKLVAPAADWFLGTIKEAAIKEAIVDRVLAGALDTPLKTLEALQLRVGRPVADLVSVHAKLSAALGDQRTAASKLLSGAGGLSKIAGDVAGAVFGRPNEVTLAYYETIIRGGQLPNLSLVSWVKIRAQALTNAVYPAFPHLFHWEFLHDLWSLVFKKGVAKGARVGAGAAVQTGARGALAGLLTRLGLKGLATAIGAGLTGGTSLLVQGAWFVGGELVGRLFGGLSWLARGGIFPYLLGVSKEEQKTSLVIILLIGVPLVVILYLSGSAESTRMSGFATSGGGEAEPGYEFVPGPAAPFATSGWPTSGCIVQGPFSATGTHRTLNAIDIDAPINTPVYAVHAGTVTPFYVMSYGIGDTTPSGYGNIIEIDGVDPNGNHYQTRYSHLAGAAPGVVPGTQVAAGQLIGYVDHNGLSYEPHLHFEYRGGGSINTILPYPVPSCQGGRACRAALEAQGRNACVSAS